MVDLFRKHIETKLNELLDEETRKASPFLLYTDIGEAKRAYREWNSVTAPRLGIVSLVTSECAPLAGIKIYNFAASIDILVNVDHMSYDGSDDGTEGEFEPVAETRDVIDTFAAASSGEPFTAVIKGESYSVTPSYSLSSAGIFSEQSSDLGTVLPLTFTVRATVVELGVNSSNIVLKINGVQIPASDIAEDMVFSSEGQTRVGAERSTFSVQEARYSLAFVTPLLVDELHKAFLDVLHGGTSEVYTVEVSYSPWETVYTHRMNIASVRLTGKVPANVGLNIELVEADIPDEEV